MRQHQWQYKRHDLPYENSTSPRMCIRLTSSACDVFTLIPWDDFLTFRAIACTIGLGSGENLDKVELPAALKKT